MIGVQLVCLEYGSCGKAILCIKGNKPSSALMVREEARHASSVEASDLLLRQGKKQRTG